MDSRLYFSRCVVHLVFSQEVYDLKNERVKTERIKQIMPISGEYSPMLLVNQEDGSTSYEDARLDGWSVMYALVDDDDEGHVAFYLMDQFGEGGLDETGVRLAPTVICNRCGRKMNVFSRRHSAPVEYSCPCGTRYTTENGWVSICE